MRNVSELLNQNGRVYVYLSSEEICDRFLSDAEKEGFTFCDGVKPTEREGADIYALNQNRTINYVGFIGHMAFQSSKKIGNQKLVKIDYKKYISADL